LDIQLLAVLAQDEKVITEELIKEKVKEEISN